MQIGRLFKEADADSSGTIEVEEFRILLRAMNPKIGAKSVGEVLLAPMMQTGKAAAVLKSDLLDNIGSLALRYLVS